MAPAFFDVVVAIGDEAGLCKLAIPSRYMANLLKNLRMGGRAAKSSPRLPRDYPPRLPCLLKLRTDFTRFHHKDPQNLKLVEIELAIEITFFEAHRNCLS